MVHKYLLHYHFILCEVRMRYDCLIHDQLLHTEDIKGAVVSLKLQGF